jgi:transcription-repair coupling factor (superfamily II helicase)
MKSVSNRIFQGNIFQQIGETGEKTFFLAGLSGSLNSFVVKYLRDSVGLKIVYCSANQESLFKLKGDIETLGGEADVYLNEYAEEFENEVSPLATILKKLISPPPPSKGEFILLLDPATLNTPVISEQDFRSKIVQLKKGMEYDFDGLISKLAALGFERKSMVEEENDFSVRGGIVDIFPENLGQPVRVEFFGNRVESIREFDPATQRSIGQVEQVEILPTTPLPPSGGGMTPRTLLSNYFDKDTHIMIDEPDTVSDLTGFQDLSGLLDRHQHFYISVFSPTRCEFLKQRGENIREINFQSRTQPAFNSNVKLLVENLRELREQRFSIFLTASDEYQMKRLSDLIGDAFTGYNPVAETLHSGFILPESKIAVYTEHEIFGRYYRAARRRFPKWKGGLSFRELQKVKNGDFIVHQKHGIGKYAGLRKIKPGGVEQEAVKLLYQDNDVLFVNLNSLSQIRKYAAQEGQKPKLSKLGGAEWERLKRKTKSKIQEIAQDLIELYARRKNSKGFRFSDDTVWQKELEASFIYEDTPDQMTATEAVKNDMQSEFPMDRLICGDVGFGKTEVAVRAAFKCVLDNKQAAVLVPTTILAEQHYNTFKDRLSNWAVEVEHFSRFKTKAEQKAILSKLEKGKINVIIGTHRLLSNDVRFKDLGLLVVDEEQRFGVKAKERIKMMKENVDVLTLTATPIPRTLNFSLLGARDMSIINTPPKNRQPIHTEIINFDRKLIANAILNELQRGGQVYFVNDKISQLEELAAMVEEIVPSARVAVAHGQMVPFQLEKVMIKFLEKQYNVLLCTKIIESGLDIPSVNTIIVNRADNFGLAELYQLRGRVGRSNIKAYAYLIAPPHSTLTQQAIRRLHALEEFSELGSGMSLALRDLEIRGAGNLLGRQQSGFISELGFETYMLILNEAINELKVQKLEGLSGATPSERVEITEPSLKPGAIVESDESVLIPEYYIEEENTRLEIYQRLSRAMNYEELNNVKEEVLDRFGKFPDQVESLFDQVELKILALATGLKRISIYNGETDFYVHLKDDEFFKSGKLERMVNFLSARSPGNVKVMQTKKELKVKYGLRSEGAKRLKEVKELVENFL